MATPLADYLTAAGPWLPLVQPTPSSAWLAWVERLVAAGIQVIEVPLRDAHACSGLRAARQAFPDLIIAAGTVCTLADAGAALDAGAHFLVSPGVSSELLEWSEAYAVPWLPGVATASDLLQCQTLNHPFRKFFPAGGVATLKAFAGPFAELKFVPSGGVSVAAARSYLACQNVVCVSASWDSATLGSTAAAVRAQLASLQTEAS